VDEPSALVLAETAQPPGSGDPELVHEPSRRDRPDAGHRLEARGHREPRERVVARRLSDDLLDGRLPLLEPARSPRAEPPRGRRPGQTVVVLVRGERGGGHGDGHSLSGTVGRQEWAHLLTWP